VTHPSAIGHGRVEDLAGSVEQALIVLGDGTEPGKEHDEAARPELEVALKPPRSEQPPEPRVKGGRCLGGRGGEGDDVFVPEFVADRDLGRRRALEVGDPREEVLADAHGGAPDKAGVGGEAEDRALEGLGLLVGRVPGLDDHIGAVAGGAGDRGDIMGGGRDVVIGLPGAEPGFVWRGAPDEAIGRGPMSDAFGAFEEGGAGHREKRVAVIAAPGKGCAPRGAR